MQIAEPTTLITDYMLGGYSLYVGLRLLALGRRQRYPAQSLWGVSFLLAALGSFLGGSMHGFRPMLPEGPVVALWLSTLSCAALAAFVMLLATSVDRLSARVGCIVAGVSLLKLVGVLFAVFQLAHFTVAILDYGSSMLFVMLVYAWSMRRADSQGAGYIVAGVLISFVAAGVQMTGIVFHEYFNYNDLFHLIQIGAMYAFYRGVRALQPREATQTCPILQTLGGKLVGSDR